MLTDDEIYGPPGNYWAPLVVVQRHEEVEHAPHTPGAWCPRCVEQLEQTFKAFTCED